MKLGTTYICVRDMKKSMNFYELLLQLKPIYDNDDRWVTFDCGNSISLYNKEYDQEKIEKSVRNTLIKLILMIFIKKI